MEYRVYPSYIDEYNPNREQNNEDQCYKDWCTAHLKLNEDPTKTNDSKYWAKQYAEQAAIVHNSDEIDSAHSGSDESLNENEHSYYDETPHEFGVWDITYFEHNEDLEDSDNSDVSHRAEDCDYCNVNGQTYRKIEKELLFVRHAEGFHNSLFEEKRVREAISVRDPDLTPNGNNQVADLRREVDMLINSGLEVEKIIVSPMTRTLQTAWGTFGGHDIPFQACHYVTEYSDAPCNYGTNKSTLQEQWPQVDFSMVPEVWWNENESEETIARRARQFREWLFKQPEKCMAVVSHAGFLHELLQEHFKNCELKRINWIHRSRKLNVSKYQR